MPVAVHIDEGHHHGGLRVGEAAEMVLARFRSVRAMLVGVCIPAANISALSRSDGDHRR